MGVSRRTVRVPLDIEEGFERTFHTTTACPEDVSPTAEIPRSRARREGFTECARCFECRMRAVEFGYRIETGGSSELVSVSGFSDFVVR